MIAVIFEVVPFMGERHRYLDLAGELRAELEKIDGFISIERFESLTLRGKLLSLSFWRDDEAVRQWRNLEAHRAAQHAGRNSIFADYRLRIGHIVRDYGMYERAEAPDDSNAVHGGQSGPSCSFSHRDPCTP
ncbi:heme-degrading monooxygenase HmoA [Pseudorhizobium tarimense]|uniref:Heme-degrading monooxygenase HmoA n=1 Tax=Pseudorhizobium tarimense TaxID=1079109 RepID=A0ABV2H160_9HYPH|nr:antibiotic biosynthesis monooxygenase [Pseudorhizobium tarimense]MCJ8517511.1 antibiotic biosynthesis monooxygenase [Pseudorhizobium tarimense]